MNTKEIKELTEKLDKKALAGAIGIMMLSWAALPIVYWLIVRRVEKGGEENGK